MAIEQNIYVTVDAVVFTANRKVLLIKRGHEPDVGKWALPGGFVEDDEELHEAAARELVEETGLAINPDAFKQAATIGTVGRNTRFRTVTVVHVAHLEQQMPVIGGDDAAEAQWFSLDNLPELAFDHGQVLEEVVRLQ